MSNVKQHDAFKDMAVGEVVICQCRLLALRNWPKFGNLTFVSPTPAVPENIPKFITASDVKNLIESSSLQQKRQSLAWCIH